MQFETFEKLIARHGSDPSRWPNPALAEQEHFKAWLIAERNLEAAVRQVPTSALSANFQDRVVAALPDAQPAKTGRYFRFGGLAAAAIACVFAGGLFLQTSSEDEAWQTAEEEIWQNAAEDIGLGDIYDWVMEEDVAL